MCEKMAADHRKDEQVILGDLYKEILHISSLAHYARIQANEADLKARNVSFLAQRATCEAECVKQVAESLSHTAHAVAKMALELTNGTTFANFGLTTDEPSPDLCTPPDKVGLKAKSDDFQGTISHSCDSPSGSATTSHKFMEAFPDQTASRETLPRDIDSSHSLPIVWEDSYQGTRERKPVSWTDKKYFRKIQRKLKNIDLENKPISEIQIESLQDNISNFIETPIDESSKNNPKEEMLNSEKFSSAYYP